MVLKSKLWFIVFALISGVIFLSPSTVLAQTPIPCGQTLTGSISTVGEKDEYTFTATAGDAVTIRLVVTSGDMNPLLELYDSTGTRIAYDYDSSGNYVAIDKALTTGGPYTIVARDYGNDETGNYNLTWQRPNNPCNATSVTCGQTTSSSISAIGEQDFYTFTATAGDAVTIRLVVTSGDMNPLLELYDSTGTRIAYDYDSSGNYVAIDKALTTGGPYIIVARDSYNDETGNYNLTWYRLNNPCNATAISCGQAVPGPISTPGELDFYTFTANAGDVVMIRLVRTSGPLSPYMELYDAKGEKLGTGNNRIEKRIETSGTFSIMVSDSSGSRTGGYGLIWQRLNSPCNGTSISCGQITSGSIDTAAEIDLYIFNASAGDELKIILDSKSSSFSPYMELYDGNGTKLASSSSQIGKRLDNGGTFALLISESSGVRTGSYRLNLNRVNTPCAVIDLEKPTVTVIAPNGGEVILQGSVFKISWLSDDNVNITSQEIRLSKDGGASFPTVIASGLAKDIQSFEWSAPKDLDTTTQARIRVVAKDAAGNIGQDDSNDNFVLLGFTQPESRVVHYEYDKLNRLTKVIYEDGSSIIYKYDEMGNRTSMEIGLEEGIAIYTNKSSYKTGDTLTLSISIYNTGASYIADEFLGFLLPDGSLLFFDQSLNKEISSGYKLPPTPFFSVTLPASMPPGTYAAFAVLAVPGSVQAGKPQLIGDISLAYFTFNP
ncbi:MAG: hypothetical protein A3G93_08880 [Nitrospinae bacterium RIFCSPLOWO2_12_FULL_45_22]|nr:MAG: hypothetical protein A3G93_08880 [Nitrospinae bacterium RIFCSPLOWO2_12_FULL_45_22]